MLLYQLNEKHSEIRVAAFLIVQELFKRSHCFRESLIADFQDFIKLVFDIDDTVPLPPPVAAARKLRHLSAKTIKEWNEVYGDAYKKLSLGFNFLKTSRIVDFEDVEARTAAERLRNEKKDAKISELKNSKLKYLREEVAKSEAEILDSVTQMKNGLSLLVPDFDFGENRSELADMNTSESAGDLREHGITNSNYNLVIEIKPVEIQLNEDNRDLVDSLTDSFILLTSRYHPTVIKWNLSASKLGASQQLQHKILDLKMAIENVIAKFNELKLPVGKRKAASQSLDSDSDSDMESVVDKDGFEETVSTPVHSSSAAPIYGVASIDSSDQPGTSGSESFRRKPTAAISAKSFDIDTYRADPNLAAVPSMSL